MSLLYIFVTVNKLNGTTEEFRIEKSLDELGSLSTIQAPAATKFTEGYYLSQGYMFDAGRQTIDGEYVDVPRSGYYTINNSLDINNIFETYTEYKTPEEPPETAPLDIRLQVDTGNGASDVDNIKGVGYYNVYVNDTLHIINATAPNVVKAYAGDTYRIEAFAKAGYRCVFPSTTGTFSGAGNFAHLIFVKLNNSICVKTENGWKNGVSYVKTENGWKQGTPNVKTQDGW